MNFNPELSDSFWCHPARILSTIWFTWIYKIYVGWHWRDLIFSKSRFLRSNRSTQVNISILDDTSNNLDRRQSLYWENKLEALTAIEMVAASSGITDVSDLPLTDGVQILVFSKNRFSRSNRSIWVWEYLVRRILFYRPPWRDFRYHAATRRAHRNMSPITRNEPPQTARNLATEQKRLFFAKFLLSLEPT